MYEKSIIRIFLLNSLLFLTITASLNNKREIDVKNDKPVKTHSLIMRTLLNEPVIYGFRAESSKHAISIDENGLTVIPDKQIITIRLFGNNFMSADNLKKIRIGFTATDGQAGERCYPDNDFTAHKIINNNMALVLVKLSETIRDKPYYLCYGFSRTDGNRYLLTSQAYSTELFWPKTSLFYYLSDSDNQAMKVRVIGRQLAVDYRSNDQNRDMNVKTKLAQIVDQVDNIHKLVDDMQDWTP